MGHLSSLGPTNGWQQPPGAQKIACGTYAHFYWDCHFLSPCRQFRFHRIGDSTRQTAWVAAGKAMRGALQRAQQRVAKDPSHHGARRIHFRDAPSKGLPKPPHAKTLHATEKLRLKSERVTHETTYRRIARRHTLAHEATTGAKLAAVCCGLEPEKEHSGRRTCSARDRIPTHELKNGSLLYFPRMHPRGAPTGTQRPIFRAWTFDREGKLTSEGEPSIGATSAHAAFSLPLFFLFFTN